MTMVQSEGTVAPDMIKPPRALVGPVAWLRQNLFSSPHNSFLTLVSLWLTYAFLSSFLSWALFSAVFTGADGKACSVEGAGACWPFITAKFGQFMYGRYPDAERWRVNLTYALAAAGLVPLLIPSVPGKTWQAVYVFVVFPVIAFFLLTGGVLGLPYVETNSGAACW